MNIKLICPHCRNEQYLVNPVQLPKHNTKAICVSCGEWTMIGADAIQLYLRKPTDDELFDIGLNADCQMIRKCWTYAFQRDYHVTLYRTWEMLRRENIPLEDFQVVAAKQQKQFDKRPDEFDLFYKLMTKPEYRYRTLGL